MQEGHNLKDDGMVEDNNRRPPFKLAWRNIILISFLHVTSLYALTLILSCHPYTLLFSFVSGFLGQLGVTAGAHRLWAHRTYKAKLPLRILLMLLETHALEGTLHEWCRNHRSHHKFTETDADPHNAKRGFFFSHVGWLLVHKHPDVARKGKLNSVEDLVNDPVVMFQKKFYPLLLLIVGFIIPTVIPWYFWGENFTNAFSMNVFRCCAALNMVWSVNSFAHLYGNQPYDATIYPRENMIVSFFAIGEGFHNYHHTFPSDYSTSEYRWILNPTTMFIDFMAVIGQVTDRKAMSAATIKSRMERTGSLAIRDAQR